LQRPSHTTYHHHKPLLSSIVNTIRYKESLNLPTKLHKIRGHTIIRGNDLADTAAKLMFTFIEEIPALQKLTVTIGKYTERSPYWFMYTNKPITPQISLSTGPYSLTLGPPWWTIFSKRTGTACMHSQKLLINYVSKCAAL
jgi:hypothetical protein